LVRQARGQEVDRIPSVGGWIGGARNLAELAGLSVEAYLADPFKGMLQAHKRLKVDGLVSPIYPASVDQIRTSSVMDGEDGKKGIEPEALLERANSIPDSEQEVLATFDAAAVEQGYRSFFESALKNWEGLVPIPNFWEIGGPFPLYQEFGYVPFLSACALYPEAVGKIWWAKGLPARERAKILVKLYKDYDLVPIMLCGEDLCNNQGPMVSPDYLRQYYFPVVERIIEPLVDAGVRLIHHCDGDVRPVVKDFMRIGFSGLQGFQYELGVDPYELKKLRGPHGEELLFFAGLNVTRTLPFGTPEDSKEEVDYLVDCTDGGKGMFLFTGNVTGVEVPPANVRAAYLHVKDLKPGPRKGPAHRVWPWSLKDKKEIG
jgi:hypothetical protein